MDFAVSPFQIKSVSAEGMISGLAAGIGDPDLANDTILPGAFTRTLAVRGSQPLPMLFQHDQARPIGAWNALAESVPGLDVQGQLTLEAPDARIALALARDGALAGISIGYVATKFQRGANGGRLISEIELHEASLVSVPMHPRSRVMSVKSITGAGDIADLLRGCGVSGRRAKAAAGVAWRAINDQSDEAAADAELAAMFSASSVRLASL
ncbi:MAG TPA: HK97 family phage prohead protease [Sphingomonas sp.]|nr:HK97 family phage prohead protease [Sphingomonas sp.]